MSIESFGAISSTGAPPPVPAAPAPPPTPPAPAVPPAPAPPLPALPPRPPMPEPPPLPPLPPPPLPLLPAVAPAVPALPPLPATPPPVPPVALPLPPVSPALAPVPPRPDDPFVPATPVRPDWSLLQAPAYATHATRPPIAIPRNPMLFIVATDALSTSCNPLAKRPYFGADEEAVAQAGAEGGGRGGGGHRLSAVVTKTGGSGTDAREGQEQAQGGRGRRRHPPGLSVADQRSVPVLRPSRRSLSGRQ